MFTNLDALVVLFMGLAFAALLSVVLMFLIRNKVVRYVAMGAVLITAACAATFGFLVGFTGAFLGQIAVAALAVLLIPTAIVLSVFGAKHPKLFLVARLVSVASMVLGMLSAFFI